MKNPLPFIRWKYALPLLIIVSAIAVFMIIFLDPVLARVIEKVGSRMNGAKVFVRDDFPEYAGGQRSAPKDLGGTTVTMHLEVANCDAAVNRAVAAGATVVMPPMDAFWGARYAMVLDPIAD